MKIALNLSLSGLIATEAYEHAGHQRFRIIESEDCLWDTDARLPDFSDAGFGGYVFPMDIAPLLERFQPTSAESTALENYASTSNNGTFFAQAGGGIVADSQPHEEYMETYNKLYSVLKSIKIAEAKEK